MKSSAGSRNRHGSLDMAIAARITMISAANPPTSCPRRCAGEWDGTIDTLMDLLADPSIYRDDASRDLLGDDAREGKVVFDRLAPECVLAVVEYSPAGVPLLELAGPA